jgi:hypothetical protein
MKRACQLIHLVPRDATLFRILKIAAQVLGVINRLFQFIPNVTLFARRLSSAHDRSHTHSVHCYIKVLTL